MKEKDLERQCMGLLKDTLGGVQLWKIRDEVTAGQPDLEVAWGGHTTKIEFKLLKKDENIHDKWEDQRQLIACVRYEQQTQRCWVVAYRAAYKRDERPETTLIYRPTTLLDRRIPSPWHVRTEDDYAQISHRLWTWGAIQCAGFDHRAVLTLIQQTHV